MHRGFLAGIAPETDITCSMSRASEVWDQSATESFFSSMKTEHVARKFCLTREKARSDLFNQIERSYNPPRRRSTLGHVSSAQFEATGNGLPPVY